MADINADIRIDNRQALLSLQQLQDRINNLGSSFGKLQGIVAGIGFGALIAQANNFARAVQNVSNGTGISTKLLQQYATAITSLGGDFRGAIDDLTEFSKKVYEASTSSVELQNAFAELGISVQDLRTLSPDQLFLRTVNGLNAVEDAGKRAKIGMETLGGEYKKIGATKINLNVGAVANTNAINAASASVNRLSVLFTNLQSAIINALEPVNGALSRVNISVAQFEMALKSMTVAAVAFLGIFAVGKIVAITTAMGAMATVAAGAATGIKAMLLALSGGALAKAAASFGVLKAVLLKFVGPVGILALLLGGIELVMAAFGRTGPLTAMKNGLDSVGTSADNARKRFERLRQEQEEYRRQTAGTANEVAARETPIASMGRAAKRKLIESNIEQEEFQGGAGLAAALQKANAEGANMKKVLDQAALSAYELRKGIIDQLDGVSMSVVQLEEQAALMKRIAGSNSVTLGVEQQRLQVNQQLDSIIDKIDFRIEDIQNRLSKGLIVDDGAIKQAKRDLEELESAREQIERNRTRLVDRGGEAARTRLMAEQMAATNRETKLFASEMARNLAITEETVAVQNAYRLAMAQTLVLGEDERRIRQAVLELDKERQVELQRIANEMQRLRDEEAAGVEDPGRARRMAILEENQKKIVAHYEKQRQILPSIVQAEMNLELTVREREAATQRSLDLINKEYNANKRIIDVVEEVRRSVSARIKEEKRGVEEITRQDIIKRDREEAYQKLLDTEQDEEGDLPLASTIEQQVANMRSGTKEIEKYFAELSAIQDVNERQSRSWEHGWKQAMKSYVSDVQHAADISRQVFNSTFSAIEGAINILTSRGRAKFREFGKAIVRDVMSDLVKISFRRLVLSLGINALSGPAFNPANIGRDITDAIPNMVPPKAKGGYIPPGKFALVGEEGPEFMSGPGMITPMNKMNMLGGGGQQVVNNISINALDSRSVAQFFAENKMLLLGTVRGAEKTLPQRNRF